MEGALLARLGLIGLLVMACGGGGSNATSTSGGSTGNAAGSSCIDYTSCGAGLYCFVANDAIEGTCETMPPSCEDCSCLGDAVASKCSSRGNCSARVGRAVYSCPPTVRKTEGEVCSVARGCENGLYCRVSTVTRSGTCEKLPAACGDRATCDCLGAEGCLPGGSVRECSIRADEASLVCE